MFTYRLTLSKYQFNWEKGNYENNIEVFEVYFSDKNIWWARLKAFIYLYDEVQFSLDIASYYHIIWELNIKGNEWVNLGSWNQRNYRYSISWQIDWEKEQKIFEQLGLIGKEYIFYNQMVIYLHTKFERLMQRLKFLREMEQIGITYPHLKRMCEIHIAIAYMKLGDYKNAFINLMNNNEPELQNLMYKCVSSIWYWVDDATEIYNKLYPNHLFNPIVLE